MRNISSDLLSCNYFEPISPCSVPGDFDEKFRSRGRPHPERADVQLASAPAIILSTSSILIRELPESLPLVAAVHEHISLLLVLRFSDYIVDLVQLLVLVRLEVLGHLLLVLRQIQAHLLILLR